MPAFFNMTAATAIQRLKGLDIELVIVEAIEETKADYADLNKAQFQAGQLNDGTDITPPYSASYARVRRREGLQTDHVDLYRTGRLYEQVAVSLDNDVIRSGSEVSYEKYLTGRYSVKLWGLDVENTRQYTKGPFWSVLKEKVETQTGFRYV